MNTPRIQTLAALIIGIALGVGGTLLVVGPTSTPAPGTPTKPTGTPDVASGHAPAAAVAAADDYVTPPTPPYFGDSMIPVGRLDGDASQEPYYIASSSGETFHRPTCRFVERIKPENRVKFLTHDEAIKSGRRPCTTCQP
ncbi:MAG: hypothetical protein GC159_16180 [Phycisphaera sp.]|nr:hypothetical protein [Phycisphaera sp.]